ncbi:hypothetical protein M1523_02590 [Patescibacteria group bacterium]|nr:hypothetical protein [Patescibacteria group bacterium]MCL5091391.1 hypothetical protein [Patescibacteria group bacterium]
MDKVSTIKTTTEALLAQMISQFEVKVEEEDGLFHVVIKADAEAPTIIGRHGETIRSLQKILEVILYKQFSEAVNLLVNVNDYREKQKERLQSMAADAAERVKENRQPSYMRGFSSYERRVIHEFVTASYPEMTTYSVGEGRDRRLVIDLKEHESSGETAADQPTEA